MARIAGFAQRVLERLCEDVGGRALGLRDQYVQRLRRDACARDRAGKQELADLRSVAMNDDQLVVEFEQREHRLRGCCGDRFLRFRSACALGRVDCIAPDGDNQAAGDHE